VMMKSKLLIVFITFFVSNAWGQNPDSVLIYPLSAFFSQVGKNHPVAKQAALLPAMAKMEIRMARGLFDPVLEASQDEKQFQNKDYYTKQEIALKIPTWFGVEFKAGIDNATGQYINPEEGTGSKGLAYGGISLPVLRGLLIDQRRAGLQQALLVQNLNEAEQIKVLNKLFLQAGKEYFEWMQAYYRLLILRTGYLLAKDRLEGIKQNILFGDLAAIDSVEASIEVMRRASLLAEGLTTFQNATLTVSTYLWDENGEPVDLAQNVIPERLDSLIQFPQYMLDSLYSYALTSHPEILKYQFKLKQYDIERRLAQEMLKPDLRLNYYPLFYSDFSGTGTDNYLLNNYKYGVNFYFPLFLRKERGKLGLTNAKITSMNYEMDQAGRDIQNTVKISWNELNNIYELVGIQKNSVSYSVTLRNGEEEKFRMGESSFFLLNTRERNLLESELKLVELQAKYAKAGLTLEWSSGRSIFSNYIK